VDVLAGVVEESSLELEDVVVRACGRMGMCRGWFWSNFDTLEMYWHSFVLLRTVIRPYDLLCGCTFVCDWVCNKICIGP
jgi:hypothetical protein